MASLSDKVFYFLCPYYDYSLKSESCSVMSDSLWPHELYSSVQLSHSVRSYTLQIHGLQHTRLPCPSPTPGAYSNSCPLSQWSHPTISSSVVPFSFRSVLPCPSPENVPNLRIKPRFSTLQADSLPAETPEKPSFPWGKRKRLFTLFFLAVNPSTGAHLSLILRNAKRRLVDYKFPTWNHLSYSKGSLKNNNLLN